MSLNFIRRLKFSVFYLVGVILIPSILKIISCFKFSRYSLGSLSVSIVNGDSLISSMVMLNVITVYINVGSLYLSNVSGFAMTLIISPYMINKFLYIRMLECLTSWYYRDRSSSVVLEVPYCTSIVTLYILK